MQLVKFNLLKLHTLHIFDEYGPLSPPAWAVLAGFYPIRAAYSYLNRLRRYQLLARSRPRGLLMYRLTAKGAARLAWLQQQSFVKGKSE